MTETGAAGSSLQHIWDEALRDYASQLRKGSREHGADVDLEKWSDVRDVNDLAARLVTQHTTFSSDAARGSTLTSTLKTGFAPVKLLMNMLGGPASAAFAPCSQIFGAVAVLITAGEKTGTAFDDIADLFTDLGEYTNRLKPLEKRSPPPLLENIIHGILVCLLKICALATKRTFHVPEQAKHRSMKQVFSGVQSNVAQFGRQLAFGADPEISAAKASLARLTKEQADMIDVLTYEKVGDVEESIQQLNSVVVKTQGLNIEISEAIIQMQADGSHMQLKLLEIGTVINGLDTKLDEVRENMLSKQDLMLSTDLIASRLEKVIMMSGLAKPTKAGQTRLPQSADLHSTRIQELQRILQPRIENVEFYKHVVEKKLMPGTAKWILQRAEVQRWLHGEAPVLCVAGEEGSGKTFLAALSQKCALLYGVPDRRNDAVYAGYLYTKVKGHVDDHVELAELWKLSFENYFDDDRGNAFLVIDIVDDCDEEEVEELLEAFSLTSAKEGRWPPKLHMMLVHGPRWTERMSSTFKTEALPYRLDETDCLGDIREAVQEKMTNSWSERLVSPSLFGSVQNGIIAACKGNFVWALLALDDILALRREDQIRERLHNLPSDVLSAMLRVLCRLFNKVDEQTLHDLNDIIACTGCSHANLSLRILDAILTLRSPAGARIINLDDMLQNEFRMLFVTHTSTEGLVHVHEDKVRARLRDEVERESVGSETLDGNGDDEPKKTATAGQSILSILPESVANAKSDYEKKLAIWDQTNVRLSHPFLQQRTQERKTEEKLPHLTMDRMHVQVLQHCLHILCVPWTAENQDVIETATMYCAVYMPQHLIEVHPDEVDSESRQVIVRLLLKVLRDDAIIDRWIHEAVESITDTILLDEKFLESVVAWLRVAQDTTDEDHEWILQAIDTPFTVILGKIARRVASDWLETSVDDVEHHVQFLIQWSEMSNKDQTYTTEAGKPDVYGLQGALLSIFQAARAAQLAETAHWFLRVGDAIRDADGGAEAGPLYKRGLELDATMPELYYGLARAYEDEDWATDEEKSSISPMIRALELLEEEIATGSARQSTGGWTSREDFHRDCLYSLGVYYRWLSRYETATFYFERLLQGWEEHNARRDRVRSKGFNISFGVLCESLDFAAASKLLQRFQDLPRRDEYSYRLLCSCAFMYTKRYLKIALETRNLDLLGSFWTTVIKSCAFFGDDGEVAAATFQRAFLTLRFARERAGEAIAEFRKVVKDPEIASPFNEYHWVGNSAGKELARVYIGRALEARQKDHWSEVGTNIDELVKLCRVDPDKEGTEIANRECSLILAAWSKLNGQYARAFECARPKIEQGINILSDNDPDNDLEAWQAIADASLVVGDLDRARAAISMHKQICQYGISAIEGVTEKPEQDAADVAAQSVDIPPTDSPDDELDVKDGNTTPQSPKDHSSKGDYRYLQDEPSVVLELGAGSSEDQDATDSSEGSSSAPDYTRECEGRCLSEISNNDAFYQCGYCIAVFCEVCHELLSRGETDDFNICSQSHERHRMPGLSERFATDCIEVGGKSIHLRDWVGDLKAFWGVSK